MGGSYRLRVHTFTAGSDQVQTLKPCIVGLRADLLQQFLHALFNALLRGISAMLDDRGEVTPLSVSRPDFLLSKQHHFLARACSLTPTTAAPCMAERQLLSMTDEHFDVACFYTISSQYAVSPVTFQREMRSLENNIQEVIPL